MDMDSENGGGSDVFWPGYVDAVTNLVLNLLFVVVIMTVAVFIFAMELGRRHLETASPPIHTPKQEQMSGTSSEVPGDKDNSHTDLEQEVKKLQQQVDALKDKEREAQKLKAELDALHKDAPGKQSKSKVVNATIRNEQPASSLEKITAGLVVDFVDDAITLSDAEAQQLRGQLGRIIASGGARLEVNVPPGFTEARRLGFYRAMAVRNLLIDMQLPADRIEVSVREGKANADSSLVLVNPAPARE